MSFLNLQSPRSIKAGRILGLAAVLVTAATISACVPTPPSPPTTTVPPAVQGFGQPFDGVAEYAQYGPSQITRSAQINRPLGQKAADKLAKKLGLNKKNVLTKTQFAQLVSGQGINGNAKDAAIIDSSVRILTNTTGNPLYPVAPGKQPIVLASYGLTVNTNGMLESPANATAPPLPLLNP